MCKASVSCILLSAVAAVFTLTAMKTSFITDLFLQDSVAEEVMIDRTYAVRPGETLRLDVDHSDVSIETGSVTEARVRVVLSGRDRERALRFYDRLQFEVDYSAGELSVRTSPQRSWNGSTGGANVDVYVTIPEVFDVDLDVAHGDLAVDDLKGNLALRIVHGTLDAGTFGGSTMRLDAAHSDVRARRFLNEKVRIDVQHGDLEIDDVTAAEFEASIAHGNLAIGALRGHPRIRIQHGDVAVRLLETQGGEFHASHGDIELSAPSGTAADLDIEASKARLAPELPFEGTQDGGTVHGRINGGGPTLTLRANHGDVAIRSN